jgi:hypothetical protein
LGFRLTTQVPHAVVPCYIRWPYLYQHGWGLVRNYQRWRKPFSGNHMNQSIPMRVSCWRLVLISSLWSPAVRLEAHAPQDSRQSEASPTRVWAAHIKQCVQQLVQFLQST